MVPIIKYPFAVVSTKGVLIVIVIVALAVVCLFVLLEDTIGAVGRSPRETIRSPVCHERCMSNSRM